MNISEIDTRTITEIKKILRRDLECSADSGPIRRRQWLLRKGRLLVTGIDQSTPLFRQGERE
jgi:hypothetical protein